jgi:hypothetical protein
MIAEQATVFALGPSAGSHLNTAVPSIALGTDNIGRPHIAHTITRRLRVPTAAKIRLLNARIGIVFYRLRRDDWDNFGRAKANMKKLSDNQVGDRLHAALEKIGTGEGETIRGNTALAAARQTLSLLEQGLLIAAERNSDDVSTMMNQPVVPPSKTLEKRSGQSCSTARLTSSWPSVW